MSKLTIIALAGAIAVASPATADQSGMAPVPATGKYGAPAVTRDGPRSGASVFGQYGLPFSLQYPGENGAVQQSPATETKQERYERLLKARWEQFAQKYEDAMKHAYEAIARGADPKPWLESAKEAARNADKINRMWLESQKP